MKTIFHKSIKINIKFLTFVCLLYFYIPCYLFILGWLKPICSIISILLLSVSLILMLRSFKNIEHAFSVNLYIILFTLFITLSIGFISGWAGYGHQTEDWPKHNAILHDLLDRKWPVIFQNNDDTALLTYYIGQYLVPAFIGKIFHLTFQNILVINWLWTSFGLFFIIMLFIYITKAVKVTQQLFCIFLVILAGGLMPLQQSLGNALYPNDITIGLPGWQDYFLTYGRIMLQFRTNFIALRWAYGQTIVPWMIILLLYMFKNDVRHYCLFVFPSILFGTFSSISIIVIAIFFFIDYCIKSKTPSSILKNTFSAENCLSVFSIGIVMFLYYLGYLLQPKPAGEGFTLVNFFNKDIGIWLIFVMGAFGLYALLIFKEYKKNIAYWACFSIMLILPFFKMGVANDLLMGACIAPSMLLYMLIAKWLFTNNGITVTFRKGIMVSLLLIGFIKPISEIAVCIRDYNYSEYVPNDSFGTLERFANRSDENIPLDVKYNYYTYDAYNSLFMKTIGK